MRTCLFVLIFLLILPFARGQEYKLYTNEDGLSKSSVTQIIKDSRGFMWIGTLVGLNRFDGYKFTNYYYDLSDSTSLSNNNIRKIIEDENGDLWIATTFGLNKYLFDYDKFIRYYHQKGSNSISDNYINSIFLDDKGDLWVATSEGIDKFDKATGQFKHFYYQVKDQKNERIPIFDITQDSRGIFWLCTNKDGLVSFSEETEQFYHYRETLDKIPIGNLVNEKLFLENNNDKLKIYARNGIFEFDVKEKKFTEPTESLPVITINNTTSYGVVNYYSDDTQMIWYAVPNRGFFSYDNRRNKFTSWSNENSAGGLIGEKVSAIIEDQDGIIWLGTNQGLCSYDPIRKEFKNRNNSKDKVYNLSYGILSLLIDRNGNLWVGTNDGVWKYNFRLSTSEWFRTDYQDTTSILGNEVNSIFEDSKGNIWVGAGGLNLYQPQDNNFRQFKPDSKSNKTVNTSYIVSIYEDEVGKLWMSTWAGGINIFDPATGEFSFMMLDPNNNGPLKTNDIASIYKDSKGFLWFSTTGATKYNPLNQQYEWFSMNDGLPHNAISDILEDKNGMIWISTGNGMALLNPRSQSVRVFDKRDGLQGNEFTYNAALKGSDGKLYFGGTNGFSIIDPESIVINEHKPQVVITDFKIFNQSVKIGEKINGKVILEKNISSTNEITLRHYESVFSFEFAALHYSIPDKNHYAYMLEGLETTWNYTDAERRFATYTTLKPGIYTFRVKASNSDGVWNDEGYAIKINILPPWWQTTWFKALIIIFLFLLILAFYYIQLYSIKKRNKKLDAMVKLKTKDLEKVNDELFAQKNSLLSMNDSLKKYQEAILIQKEEISLQNKTLQAKNTEILDMSQRLHDHDQNKLRYFTNISHEFRTPLTLIISPLDKLIHSQTIKKEHLKQLTLIEANAKRLLGMVNQLLDIRKIESGNLPINKEPGDFVEFCKTIFNAFLDQATTKNINFKFTSNKKELNILFDLDKLEKILYNVLSNSFKFTHNNGSITFGIEASNKKVEISISDTGIGIPDNKIRKIFDPFYQVDPSSTRANEGSGIGLYFTHELVELIEGSIKVTSEPGAGTMVIITFPCECIEIGQKVKDTGPNPIDEGLNTDDHIEIIHADDHLKLEIKPTLLIVEDNLQMRGYIKDELSPVYKILEAGNGIEGLEMARKSFPDLIVSDIMMPEMDGLEMCSILKEDELISHIPIILLTAKVEEVDAIEGIETGADDYMAKPFNIKFLEAKIEQLLVTRRKLREKYSKEVFSEPSNIAYTNADRVFLQKLITLVETNLSNEDFLVNDIARSIGMGKTNLYKKVLALTNQSVADFVRGVKLKKAAHLLSTNEYSVSEVAYQVGFKDASHFIKSFTRQYGYTPKKFMEQQRIGSDNV